MARFCVFESVLRKLAHWPTLMILVGYPVFWAELLCGGAHTAGRTSLWGVAILGISSIFYFFYLFRTPQSMEENVRLHQTVDPLKTENLGWLSRFVIILILILGGCLLFYVAWAAWYPLHLPQEIDALIYHVTLPRQHLLSGSFTHLQWSGFDLFPLPLQFALAPFWLVNESPNKLPQYFFLIGLIAVCLQLSAKLGFSPWRQRLLFICLLGSHHLGVQMGTAMLDIPLTYLFFAAIDSHLSGKKFFAIVEMTFFLWSKSFMPIYLGLLVIVIVFLIKIFKIIQVEISIGKFCVGKYMWSDWVILLIFSLIVGGPFVSKSLYYGQTPLFPLAVGSVPIHSTIDKETPHWQSLRGAAKLWTVDVKEYYGYGRSIGDFFKHFWFLAVPDKAVNNKFDYPVGLVYLLFLGPFLYYLSKDLRHKELSLIAVIVVIWWGLWWMGSQQSRFLYIPSILMIFYVLLRYRSPSQIFICSLGFAFLLNMISIFRAHYHVLGKHPHEVFRASDKELIGMNRVYAGKNVIVPLYRDDLAFACFPVVVTPEQLPHVLWTGDD